MTRVFITDYIRDPDIERGVLGDRLASQMHPGIEVLLVWHRAIGSHEMDALPGLRAIVRYGVGTDGIDLEAANRRGIAVCNTPDYGTEEVSDSALAMVMNAVRGISRYDGRARQQSDGWQEETLPELRRTGCLTLGVVGAGRIGGSLLLKAKALRFKTAFYDPYVPRGHEKMLGARRFEELHSLLAACDIVSLHTPLTAETRGMVNRSFLKTMRPGSILVNTARGGLTPDLDLLGEALGAGWLSHLALDVLPEEPPSDGPLIEAWRRRDAWLDGRLVINPHSAYYSREAWQEMRVKASENALRILSGQAAWNVVNTPGPERRPGKFASAPTSWSAV